jgi:hypothetical protein
MMQRIPNRQRALKAVSELLASLDLSETEQRLILGIALEKYAALRLSVRPLGLRPECLSAIFAAALEYSETLTHPDD